jgi:putative ABC transport system permease protein
LRHHKLISGATILGVAVGMCVVCAILIVDSNTARNDDRKERLATSVEIPDKGVAKKEGAVKPRLVKLPITRVQIIKRDEANQGESKPGENEQGESNEGEAKQGESRRGDSSGLASALPSQKLSKPVTVKQAQTPKGEEDYQTMRLAVRMASMFAFFIGAVIVFYTMRFSVAMRVREFSLLLCLGEDQRNVSLSLLFESLILGAIGTGLGLLVAYPAGLGLLELGISTTGRAPSAEFSVPWIELFVMVFISLVIVLLGVIAPIYSLSRLQISQVLQPRFAADEIGSRAFRYTGFSWLIFPLLLASWLAVRPFLESWLSVIYFFIAEAVFVVLLTLLTVWLTRPLLSSMIWVLEAALGKVFPLETLLSVRRIRLNSHKFVFSITGVVLVFSLLAGLHTITRTLQDEIQVWSDEAMSPYLFYTLQPGMVADQEHLQKEALRQKVHMLRLSQKVTGSFPLRLVVAEDYNRYREEVGLPLFTSGQVIFSRSLAARFDAEAGDTLRLDTEDTAYDFEVVEISDAAGGFPEASSYIDLKSFALFTDGNPVFRNNLELTLGNYLAVRSAQGRDSFRYQEAYVDLKPYYHLNKSGRELRGWQLKEIEKDFFIFDFIIMMTVILAFIGIVNTLLIQVHARGRELGVLRTQGVDKLQLFRLLLAESLVIGVIGAGLAVMLGNVLGMVSVSFLDSFTLFNYVYSWSWRESLKIVLFALFTCSVSAIYPALVATRTSTAESVHYE